MKLEGVEFLNFWDPDPVDDVYTAPRPEDYPWMKDTSEEQELAFWKNYVEHLQREYNLTTQQFKYLYYIYSSWDTGADDHPYYEYELYKSTIRGKWWGRLNIFSEKSVFKEGVSVRKHMWKYTCWWELKLTLKEFFWRFKVFYFVKLKNPFFWNYWFFRFRKWVITTVVDRTKFIIIIPNTIIAYILLPTLILIIIYHFGWHWTIYFRDPPWGIIAPYTFYKEYYILDHEESIKLAKFWIAAFLISILTLYGRRIMTRFSWLCIVSIGCIFLSDNCEEGTIELISGWWYWYDLGPADLEFWFGDLDKIQRYGVKRYPLSKDL